MTAWGQEIGKQWCQNQNGPSVVVFEPKEPIARYRERNMDYRKPNVPQNHNVKEKQDLNDHCSHKTPCCMDHGTMHALAHPCSHPKQYLQSSSSSSSSPGNSSALTKPVPLRTLETVLAQGMTWILLQPWHASLYLQLFGLAQVDKDKS